jgi:hypothetical protein
MRIWHPIPPLCLDRQRLLGEHRELHAIWSILSQDKKGYRNHPEVKRWEGRLRALSRRHGLLVVEMSRRGYRHASPLLGAQRGQGWPETWEPVQVMRAKLAVKQDGLKL